MKEIQEESKQKKIDLSKRSIPQFKNTGLLKEIVDRLGQMDINTPSSIQQLAINQLLYKQLNFKAFFIAGQTGTGKTLAYLLPILHNLKQTEINTKQINTIANRPQCIIIVPSKELIEQTYNVIKQFIHHVRFKVLKCGHSLTNKQEENELNKGVDIIVCSLERLNRLREKGLVYLSNVQWVVFDEADTFLDSGQGDQVVQITNLLLRKDQKVIFVGATFTGPLSRMFDRLFGCDKQQQDTFLKKIIEKNTHYNLMNIDHQFIHLQTLDKFPPLFSLLKEIPLISSSQLMIFCNSIPACQALEYRLKQHGYDCVSIHGDTVKQFRIQNHNRFTQNQVNILISTDVGSRGLDFPNLKYVINFDFPQTSSDYLHRAGRTGRANRKGIVYSFYHHKDHNLIKELQSSHQNNRPLEIKNSAYSKINKEVFRESKKSQKQIPDKIYETSKNLLPASYVEFAKKHHKGQQQAIHLRPPKSRNHVQLRLIAKQRNKIKKNQRMYLQKNIKGLNILQRKLKRKMFYEDPKNKNIILQKKIQKHNNKQKK